MKLAVFLIVLTVLRLAYIGQAELSPDEAQYHQWSQRLDWCYFSKGPGVAAAMKASTSLFGHGEFGVRAFAPLLALGTSVLLYWLARRIYDYRVATWAVVLINLTPMFNAGGLIMSIDPLSIFFWTATLCSMWMALEKSPSFSLWWPLTGLLIGAGFLCKYTNAFALLSVLLLLVMTPRFRRELLRPGFYTMLLAFLPALIPVYIWHEPRGWPILNHLSSRGGLETAWWDVNLQDFFKFIATHFGVYSPLIFVGMLVALWVELSDSAGRWFRALLKAPAAIPAGLARHWGMVLVAILLSLSLFFAGNFWEIDLLHKLSKAVLAIAAIIGLSRCKEAANIHWKSRFLAAFALPIILVYAWIALHHDSEVNWTAPAAVSVFILTAAYWIERTPRKLGIAAVAVAAGMSIIGVQPDIVRAIGIPWSFDRDHTARVRGWRETARVVDEFRAEKEKEFDRRIFLIAENYGLASELCHYLPPREPEGPGHPACYVEESPVPANQYNFWPKYDDYEARTTPATNTMEDNSEIGVNRFAGRTAIYVTTRDEKKPPSVLMDTFEEWRLVKDVQISEGGKPLRKIRFFICHRYKPGQLLN